MKKLYLVIILPILPNIYNHKYNNFMDIIKHITLELHLLSYISYLKDINLYQKY